MPSENARSAGISRASPLASRTWYTFCRAGSAGAFRKPLTASAREGVNRLIASLSLLSPDPQTRLASVRDVAERAARAYPDPKAAPADQKKNLDELARYGTALKRLQGQPADAKMAAALREAGAAVDGVPVAAPGLAVLTGRAASPVLCPADPRPRPQPPARHLAGRGPPVLVTR
jgi:hypothetical protein